MRLEQLKNKLLSMERYAPSPDFIIVHVGGNNLGTTRKRPLLWQMKSVLSWVMARFPNARVMYSGIVQRGVYRGQLAASGAGLEMARRFVNGGIHGWMQDRGLVSFGHENIRFNLPYFLIDQVHLNETGNELFVQNFIIALRRVCRPIPV